MSAKEEPIIGILGGMGPEATVDLMQRIINNTVAFDDADHIRCIIDNNPKTPSRIKALIEKTGESPGPCMADMGKRLEAWGADVLAIACNTAHYYYPDIKNAVKIPVLNMLALTVEAALQKIPNIKKVGILASPAVRDTRLYTDLFDAKGVIAIYPSEKKQVHLFEIIRAIKRGDTGEQVKADFAEVVADIAAQGAELGIIACTELGVLGGKYNLELLDAAEVLAVSIVKYAKGANYTSAVK